MRTAFINELVAQARSNPKLFLLVGDLGFSVVETFAEEFPGRYLNIGIAEQNMSGVAAGLASEGWHVFTYSIANFPTIRCLEQIRNDICYHKLPVTVVAVGAGFAYGNLGYSHHAVQDIACLRGMPNITVYSPADPGEARGCLRHNIQNPGPAYLRLGKAGEPHLHEPCDITQKLVLIRGAETAATALVATGSILEEALKTYEQLPGADLAIYSMPIIAPLDATTLAPLWRHSRILTLEEHVRTGGLGELIAAWRPKGVELQLFHAKENLSSIVGSQKFLRKKHEIDTDALAAYLVRNTQTA
jgi:transketolase